MFSQMRMTVVSLAGIFLLFGCAGNTAPPPPQQAAAALSPANQTPAATAVEAEPKDPCEEALEKAVQEARTTRKTVTTSCEGKDIEATPRWSFNYAGEVHLVVRNAQGEILRDEVLKPAPQTP